MRNFKEANQFIVALQQHWKQHLLMKSAPRVTRRNLWSDHAMQIRFLCCLPNRQEDPVPDERSSIPLRDKSTQVSVSATVI